VRAMLVVTRMARGSTTFERGGVCGKLSHRLALGVDTQRAHR
jgi:hypothetical protein